MHPPLLSLPALLATAAALGAQAPAPPPPPPAVAAVARTGPIVVDGRLDEAAWASAPAATGFRQRDPAEGAPATQRTEVRFVYDGDALYVGARMFDSRGAAGVRARLARRDAPSNADYLMLVFDTYHDRTGRIVLRVSPSGVKYDALAAGAADPDPAWDAVWDAATRVDSLGWTAELRIPFAQLRTPTASPQTWGLQIWRYEQRLNETSQWSFWSKRDAGGPASFGTLTGIEPTTGTMAIEAVPYVSVDRRPSAAAGATVAGGARTSPALGGDLLLRAAGVAATLTVDPDFGQVEVDPAVLNLTAVETFLPEKRQFFVQDAGVLGFGAIDCFACTGATPLRLYYSRRIGHPPSANVVGRVVQEPTVTRVLGAARATAQAPSGWTLGALAARTATERATLLDSAGRTVTQPVEPAATELVARADRRSPSGDAMLGLTGTVVARDVGGSAMRDLAALLPARATTVGSDAERWWNRRRYHVSVLAALTEVDGGPLALARLQTSSVHYFQRPGRRTTTGAFDTRYDTTRTLLRGYGGGARVAREAGRWTWEGMGEVVSGGFEANDLGYVPTAGTSWLAANVRRAFTTPTRWYHDATITGGWELRRNDDRDPIGREWHATLATTTPDYWTVSAALQALPAHYDDRRLRGGPTVGVGRGAAATMEVATDARGPISADVTAWARRNASGDQATGVAPAVTVRPSDALTLSLGPSVERQRVAGQLVAPVGAAGAAGRRSVVAVLHESTAAVEARVSLVVAPTLTIDAYVQPFLSAGAYADFGEYAAPRAPRRLVYGRDVGTVRRGGGDTLVVDPDGAGPQPSFVVRDPTGTTRSLRGSSVLRWEYRPGAALSLAWTQTRLDDGAAGELDIARDGAALFRSRPINAFLAKLTYRVGE